MQTAHTSGTTIDARAALEAIIDYIAEKNILGDLVDSGDKGQIDGYLDPIAERFAAALGLVHARSDK